MATNCYVGKLNEDNTVDCIFVKFNGDYENNGADLLKDFNSQDSVNELITSRDGNTLYDKCKDQPYKVSFEEYDRIFEGTFIEYLYLWKDNQWFAKDCYHKKGFTPLNKILEPVETVTVTYKLRKKE